MINFHKPLKLRRPQHTGEYVYAEPLAVFLRRRIWTRPDNERPAAPRVMGEGEVFHLLNEGRAA